MVIKYAQLVFTLPYPFPFPKVERNPLEIDANTRLERGSIKDLLSTGDLKQWPTWVGSLTWDSLNDNRLILSTWKTSKNAEVIDEENEALTEKLLTLFRLLPLVAPFVPSPTAGEAYILTGKASIKDGKISEQDLRSLSRVRYWTRQLYADVRWEEFDKWAEPELFETDRTLHEWKDLFEQHHKQFVQIKDHRQLMESYRSFDEAMRATRQMEFKLPNLVRSLECLIDCHGAVEFATRVLKMTGPLPSTLPYGVSLDTHDHLKMLYQLRNDCSHGKPFAYSYRKQKGTDVTEAEVAMYEFLAEWCARKVLVSAFKNQAILTHGKERDSLVNAWENGLI